MSVTFEVSEVAKPTKAPATISVEQAMQARLGTSSEAHAANLAWLIETPMHPVVNAAHLAFAEHHGLTLTPDDVWLCIAQGFAQHVDLHAEELRDRFVTHEGKAEIVVIRDEFRKGSATNDWQGVFGEFSDAIAKHIGKQRDLVVANFSTTGAIEKAASEVVLMSAMKNYFEYTVLTRCGIPRVTLLGTPVDWLSIKQRAAVLAEYGLAGWLKELEPVLSQLHAAASGSPDLAMWRSFYKFQSGSGGDRVTGWINTLFPYIRKQGSIELVPNPCLAWRGAHGVAPRSFPAGMSIAPFTWKYLGTDYPMDFAAGFVAVALDGDNVRPAIGWAVRDRPAD